MKVICVMNVKGGVGKTTTTINLGSILALLKNKKVLIIDSDPQGHSTLGLGIKDYKYLLSDLLINNIDIKDVIINTGIANLDIIPSNLNMADLELLLNGMSFRESVLSDCLTKYKKELEVYDYIIIDCNPSIGLVTINALSASDKIIIPTEGSGALSVDGMVKLLSIITLIKKKINPALALSGVLLTRSSKRHNIDKEIKQELMEIFGDNIYETVIYSNVSISESQKVGLPVILYNLKATGSLEYIEFTNEFLRKEGEIQSGEE